MRWLDGIPTICGDGSTALYIMHNCTSPIVKLRKGKMTGLDKLQVHAYHVA
jgi:hypothetical protein